MKPMSNEGHDPAAWEKLMHRVVEGDYKPGNSLAPGPGTAPGSGTEGDSPLGLKYVNMGPLALVLNEAVDATVTRGADRDALLALIAQTSADDDHDAVQDVTDTLSGALKCPDPNLMAAFATALAIDLDVILDAAERGGCTGTATGLPPGTPPGF
jgi:hypothetical protein